MPKEDKLVEPTPELMRLRIISVAALNCGTYFGGDSIAEVSAVFVATDVLELGWLGESILTRLGYRNRNSSKYARSVDEGTSTLSSYSTSCTRYRFLCR